MSDREPPTLAETTVTRLLELGIAGPRRPLDALIDRLSAADGSSWFAGTLEGAPFGGADESHRGLIDGASPLDDLESLKNEGKRLLASGMAERERLAGLSAYFLAVSAALAHHRTNISSRPPHDLSDALLDLASVLPSPWSGMVARGAMRLTGE